MGMFKGLITSISMLLLSALSTLHAGEIARFETSEPWVCLTFDDGPIDGKTQRIIEILRRHKAKATFYVIGERIGENMDALRSMVRAGHEIGNHTYTHPNLAQLDDVEQIRKEIEGCQQVVGALTGEAPVTFRAPFFGRDERVQAVLESLGLPSVLCSADTRDWDPKIEQEELLERAIAGLKPGAILLMHEFSDKTIAMLPLLLAEMELRGLRSITVAEAIARTKS
jgi:peptidoglycan-N-acetylglucosamine deacetylase